MLPGIDFISYPARIAALTEFAGQPSITYSKPKETPDNRLARHRLIHIPERRGLRATCNLIGYAMRLDGYQGHPLVTADDAIAYLRLTDPEARDTYQRFITACDQQTLTIRHAYLAFGIERKKR